MIKKKRSNKFRKKSTYLIFLFTFFILILNYGYAFFNQSLNIEGTANIDNELKIINHENCDTSVVVSNGFWTDGISNNYEYSINLKNNAVSPLYGWGINFKVPNNSTINTVNSIYTLEDNLLSLKGMSYNNYIASQDTINFKIYLKTIENFVLREINIDNCQYNQTIENDVELDAEFINTGSWGIYKQYNVIIKNTSNINISAWKLTLEFPSDLLIENAWNTNYSRTENTIVFTNMSYNGSINSNSNIEFGMQIKSVSLNFDINIKEAIGSK